MGSGSCNGGKVRYEDRNPQLLRHKMSPRLVKTLTSGKLWCGLYLLSYGALLEITYFAASCEPACRWLYNVAVLGLAGALAWKLAVWTKKHSKLAWVPVLLISAIMLAICIFYVPWVLSINSAAQHFGWPETVARVARSLYNLFLVMGGTALLVIAFRERGGA